MADEECDQAEQFAVVDGQLVTEARSKVHRAVRQLASPNCNFRPSNCPEEIAGHAVINLLVIHNISLPPGQFGGGYVEEFFQNKLMAKAHPFFQQIASLQVSAHLFICRAGGVTQFVNFKHRAWHAGESSYAGRANCNDFSIGIELEGTDEIAFTQAQYASLVSVSLALGKTYPEITPASTTGHSDIAPGRKTDPGPCFDWHSYRTRWSGS